MWHKPCRTFHPWCPCIKTRCLVSLFITIGNIMNPWQSLTNLFWSATICLNLSHSCTLKVMQVCLSFNRSICGACCPGKSWIIAGSAGSIIGARDISSATTIFRWYQSYVSTWVTTKAMMVIMIMTKVPKTTKLNQQQRNLNLKRAKLNRILVPM